MFIVISHSKKSVGDGTKQYNIVISIIIDLQFKMRTIVNSYNPEIKFLSRN